MVNHENRPVPKPGENKPSRTWLWPAVWIFAGIFVGAIITNLILIRLGKTDTWTAPIIVVVVGVIGVWIASAIARKDKGGL